MQIGVIIAECVLL